MNYTTFDTFIEYINAISDQKITLIYNGEGHIGIHHHGKQFPISINESEFNFMQYTIITNNLTKGFELSTGTGVSTIGLGRAFLSTNGNLTSLDSYYEEMYQLSQEIPIGNHDETTISYIKQNSPAYKLCENIINKEQLPINLEIGWSPTDLEKTIKHKPLDFVFLDCPKSDSEFERDFNGILPFLNSNLFFMFVHDTHTFTKKSFDLVKSKLNVEMKLIYNYYENTLYERRWKYPMALITNK
jgi:predicted O-methyltransferase YrrM